MRYLSCLLVCLTALSTPDPAKAHPHVFVDAQAGFTFDDTGALVALRITWTYDAFTSLTLFDILDLDRDGDMLLDDEDRAKIVAGETQWAEGYYGDTYLETDGQNIGLTRPENGKAWLADSQISVSFDLPLAAAHVVENETVLKLYDPSYYYAYKVVGVEEVDADGCDVTLVPFEPDAQDESLLLQLAQLSREEIPEQENVGRQFADQVRLTCS